MKPIVIFTLAMLIAANAIAGYELVSKTVNPETYQPPVKHKHISKAPQMMRCFCKTVVVK